MVAWQCVCVCMYSLHVFGVSVCVGNAGRQAGRQVCVRPC